MDAGLGLEVVERAKLLVDFAIGLVVFTDVERAKELVPLEAAAGARSLETGEG